MTWNDVTTIISGVPWTLGVTGAALLFGIIFGFPLLMLRQSRFSALRGLMLVLIALVRGVPPIVWLFIIFFGIGTDLIQINPFSAAVITFGFIAATNMAEIYRGGLLAIHHGQYEAAESLNFNRWYKFWDVIFPQMTRVAIPSTATYAIGLLKDSAIASTIGVRELAYQGRYVTEATFHGLPVLALVGAFYILASLPIAVIARRTDAKLRRSVAR
ncbi:amino acid ABC transporter permease [Mesorhizobium sp.]|uniref:amino acid ABC transporter permease n=1 Tax=Mesorhizobium sp. TaxID=1871066 RepID=UPI000FE6B3B6|nr:amino acid ABC transporter permease [Mesorhizobium sp.]RWB69975.1 MAG: amino acid ABC transporter permease [Mesorhizobium sp.]